MRRIVPSVAVLVALLVVGAAAARGADAPGGGGRPAAAAPKRREGPPTVWAAADAVLAARKAADARALKALAERSDPSPWDVAHELVLRGELDAAEAFARAAVRPRTEGLAAYVASRRKAPADPAVGDAVRALHEAERRSEDAAAVLELLSPVAQAEVLSDPLLTARARWLVAAALETTGRLGEAREAYDALASLAERLGNRGLVVAAVFRGGECVRGADADLEDLVERRRRLVDANEAMEEPQWLAFSLARYGLGLVAARRTAEAEPVLTRATAMQRPLAEDRTLLLVLGYLRKAYYVLERGAESAEVEARAAAAAERVGDAATTVDALVGLAIARARLGTPKEAVAPLEKAMKIATDRADAAAIGRCEGQLGIVRHLLGDDDASLELHQRALRKAEAAGDRELQGINLIGIADVQWSRGDLREAIELAQRALDLGEEAESHAFVISTLARLGNLYREVGDLPSALGFLERAAARLREHPGSAARPVVMQGLGLVHIEMGDHGAAIARLEEALAAAKEARDDDAVALVEMSLGSAFYGMGDVEGALAHGRIALGLFEKTGNAKHAGAVLGNLGIAEGRSGDLDAAEAAFRRSREVAERASDRASAWSATMNLAIVRSERRDWRGALAELEALSKVVEAAGIRGFARRILLNVGLAKHKLGDRPAAVSTFERVAREAERYRDHPMLVLALEALAEAHLLAGRTEVALATARRAMPYVEQGGQGHADDQSLSRRAEAANLFEVGARAAARQRDAAEVAYFLEAGRAGALLEALSNRAAMRDAVLPEELRVAESSARAALAAVTSAYQRAVDAGDLKTVQARRKAVEQAEARLKDVAASVQRAQKSAANVLYPRAATLDELMGALTPDEALVLYGVFADEGLALVVTPSEGRIVPLGVGEAVEDALVALLPTDATTDVAAATAAVTKHLVDPLALGDAVRRVYVCPDGRTAYVPFSTLLPGRDVVCVPSGTTLLLLRSDASRRGDGVLALGAPDYEVNSERRSHAFPSAAARRGGPRSRLAPLPGSGDEARTVGDVTLLGAEATEDRLVVEVAKRRRWRALHFACHGFVDVERPAFSALALTATQASDGFLSCLDVFRMRMPTDLVVLSACETGRGKIVRGEGIVGLTRAFMFAGAPRVLCSLWKVDDEATRALMTKFYALWNPKDGTPGLPTAEALRRAQEFVRSHEKWKHPYYWAAWVLWGLPS